MKRREFIALAGGAVVAWPRAARAQQSRLIRRVGALYFSSRDGVLKYHQAFLEELRHLGWTEGGNIQPDVRFAAGDSDRLGVFATELVGFSPEVVVASSPLEVRAVQQQTRSIPIVFTAAVDPVSQGLVGSIRHPGGNVTGCSSFEFSMGGKWVELLKEIAPNTARVAVIFNPKTAPYIEEILRSIEVAAAASAVKVVAAPIHDDHEMEIVIGRLASEPSTALILPPDIFTSAKRHQIVALAAQHPVPAIYSVPSFTEVGGLLAYGPDLFDNYRRTATYVDRILKGANPAELPVEAPIKFLLVVNLTTAKALGLAIPPSLLARADEVIE
jgi:putative tryptophan/tyrosine transport system substrate-binding protein